MTEIEIETRSYPQQVAAVSFPNRLIELVVAPYETVTDDVVYRGRLISEVISRGAFDGIADQKHRIVKANRDHDVRRTIGRAVAFHPSREDGLVAEIKVSDTDLGRETLTLCDDGVLGASAGFTLLYDKAAGRIKPGAEVWETRSRRRLNHLWLHHVAFTPDPQYDDAKILSVRAAAEAATAAAATAERAVSMPNLERLQLEIAREQYAAIDKRYSLGQH